MNTLIPANQLRTACRLAAAHGHLWAEVYGTHYSLAEEGPQVELLPLIITDEGETVANIIARSLPRAGCCEGICAPNINVNGEVYHTTGTSRISWLIFANGSCTIQCHRPNGDINIEAVVHYGADAASLSTNGPYWTRHVEAILTCLRALLTPSQVAQAQARLCEEAGDDILWSLTGGGLDSVAFRYRADGSEPIIIRELTVNRRENFVPLSFPENIAEFEAAAQLREQALLLGSPQELYVRGFNEHRNHHFSQRTCVV